MIKKNLVSFFFIFTFLITVFFVSTPTFAATSVCTNLNSNIALGSLDRHYATPDVTRLQNFLVSQNLLSSAPNGTFGLQTQTAVKAFQTKYGLESTGFVGTLTRNKIKETSCGSVTPIVPQTVTPAIVATTTSSMSVCQFVELLITIGVITPDKVTPARVALKCSAGAGVTSRTNAATSTCTSFTYSSWSSCSSSVQTRTVSSSVPATCSGGVTPVLSQSCSSGGGGGGGGGGSAPVTYIVTYNANGAATGTVPTDSAHYSSGSSVIVPGNTGSLTKGACYAFSGWNTATDGSGSGRLASSTFAINSNVTLYAQFEGSGDGSVGNPCQISSWNLLDNVRNNLSSSYILTANLSSTTPRYAGLGSAWTPIGSSTAVFSGNFNGNRHTISDLTINLPSTSQVGLFGWTNSGNFSNIGLININVTGSGNGVGGLVGLLGSGGIVSNSYSTGSITGSGNGVGGLIGESFGGGASGGTISSSYSTANVTGSAFTGGLVGDFSTGGSISNSYSTGNVVGRTWVGGLVGNFSGTVSNSYSTGRVSSSDGYVGGLIGVKQSARDTTSNSFWDTQTSGQSASSGGTGTTTTAMKIQATYASWDMALSKADLNNSYPYLGMQVGTTSHAWFIKGRTVTYDGNGSDGGSVPVDPLAYNNNATTTVLDAGSMTRTNLTFAGWNTLANGLGTNYATSSVLTFGSSDITLYAVWKAKVTYNANDATSGTVPVDSSLYSVGATTTVLDAGSMARANCTFTSWNTQADGLGINYATSSVLTFGSSNIILYAMWTSNFGGTYILSYDVNGGNGQYVQQIIAAGATTSLIHVTFTKPCNTRTGWNTSADGSGTTYTDNSIITITRNLTLYAQWEGGLGDGSVGNPCQIASWNLLNNVRDNLASNYILTTNLSSITSGYAGIGNTWVSIGDISVPFSGSFNGGNKTISNLVADAGLFNAVSGNISNIGLVNVTSSIGGLVGTLLQSGTITNSYSIGNVSGGASVGGLVGNSLGSISKSYSAGSVSGDSGVGGLVGDLHGNATVSNSYSTSNVSGSNYVGGLIGMEFVSSATTSNSFSTGNVTSSGSAGGLVGWAYIFTGTTTSSYWDTTTSGTTTSAGGAGTTTAAMKTQSTYAGWDFSTIWNWVDGQYPTLK